MTPTPPASDLAVQHRAITFLHRPRQLASWAPIPLRLIIGAGFMLHGYAKLARGPEVFAATLDALHVPAPFLMACLTIGGELFGGFAILIGFLIPLISVPLIAILVVAIITVHLPYGFSTVKLLGVTAEGPHFGAPGYEMNLLYIAGLVGLIIGGAGPLAIDSILLHRFARRR